MQLQCQAASSAACGLARSGRTSDLRSSLPLSRSAPVLATALRVAARAAREGRLGAAQPPGCALPRPTHGGARGRHQSCDTRGRHQSCSTTLAAGSTACGAIAGAPHAGSAAVLFTAPGSGTSASANCAAGAEPRSRLHSTTCAPSRERPRRKPSQATQRRSAAAAAATAAAAAARRPRTAPWPCRGHSPSSSARPLTLQPRVEEYSRGVAFPSKVIV